jgi:hypothetical protein
VELARLIQHHLDGVLVLAELVSFVFLTSTRSPRASLNNSHLLGTVFVVMTLVLPLAMTIMVVMSALAECRLRLASGWHWLDVLYPCSGVSGGVLVRYRHEVSHCFWLGPMELMLQQGPISAPVREVANGLLLAHSFA